MSDFSALLELFEQTRLPPVEQWMPTQRGEIDIRIKQNGEWWHEGAPIQRKKLVKLFASILRKEHGEYYLVTPVEQLKIEVEDAPFVAVEVQKQVANRGHRQNMLMFRTNVDDVVLANADHMIFSMICAQGKEKPYVHVRNGLNARIGRSVYYELADMAEPSNRKTDEYGVWSGSFFHVFSGSPLR